MLSIRKLSQTKSNKTQTRISKFHATLPRFRADSNIEKLPQLQSNMIFSDSNPTTQKSEFEKKNPKIPTATTSFPRLKSQSPGTRITIDRLICEGDPMGEKNCHAKSSLCYVIWRFLFRFEISSVFFFWEPLQTKLVRPTGIRALGQVDLYLCFVVCEIEQQSVSFFEVEYRNRKLNLGFFFFEKMGREFVKTEGNEST